MYSVLYVDDENSLLELGKLFLENTGEFQVETAISASCGLEILTIRSFDAIVSDYQMPGMDGIVFLKEIRSRHGDLPFILFTGKGREEVVIQAINNGVNFYLQKGGEPESQFAELGHKIQQAIQRKRAEDALRINEERLSMAQSIGGIGSWEFDPVTKILWGSPEAFRIFGYPSSMDGTIHLDEVGVCIPERERVRLALENLIENGEEYNLEYDIIPSDASGKKILHSVGHLYRGASGTVIKVRGVIQDITVRKKFEEQIIRERENFHKILSTAPVGLLLINQDYVITQANQYIASIVFREPAEIIGKRAGGGIGCVHSTEEPRGCGFSTSCPECPLRKGIGIVLNEGKSLNGVVIDHSFLINGKPEQRWLSVNIEPVEFEHARFTIVAVDDITAHMEYEEERIRKSDELNAAYEQIAATEEELRQNYTELAAGQQLLQASRQYLQSIVQGSPIPTFVIDNEHKITSWNQALEDYLGISADLVIGKPLAGQAFYKANRPSLADLIVNQAFDEIPKWYEGKFVPSQKINGAYEVTDFFPTMKGGTWLFFTASPIYDVTGALIGAVETLQDITERKRAEEKLSRTNEDLSAAFEELAATEEELRQNLDEISITQSDLLESEVRFRSAMNHLPGTAWAVDRTLKYTLSQGAGLSLIGLKPDQVVGMTLYEFFSTSDPSHPVISQHLRALSGESIVYDYTHEGVSFRTYLSPLHDTYGTIAGVNGLAFDITEQKRAEEERRRSEEWFRNIFSMSPIAIELYNNEGALIDINPACCALFGIQSAVAVKGLNLFEDPNIPLNQRELLKTGRTLQYESDFDFDLVKKLNLYSTTRSGKISLNILVTPIQAKERITTGYLVQIIDITERKKADAALRESEEHLAEAQRLGHFGSWTYNLASGKIHWTAETFHIIGVDPSQGEPDFPTLISRYHPDDRDDFVATVQDAVEKGVPYYKDWRLLLPDGSTRYIHARGQPVIENGAITGLWGTIQDITERKLAGDIIAESEQRLTDIIDFLPDATFVIDKNRRIISWNRAIEQMSGILKKDIIGKGDYAYAFPFYGKNIPMLIDSLFLPGVEIDSRYTNIRRGGDTIDAEVFVSSMRGGEGAVVWATASALYDNTGAVIGAIESIRDITDRRKAETALQESFETFRTVMDSLDALVYVADLETHELLFVNQYGRKTWGDITGKICWKSLQSNQNGPCTFCTNDKLVDSVGNPTGILAWEFQNSITRRWYECRDSAIQWIDGRIVRLEIATDITERKKAEDALIQANRQLKLLSGITRHDILNQVTVCLGYIGIIKKKFHDPTLGEYLGKIESTTKAIRSQIEFTRVYQDLGTHEPQWHRLDNMLPRSQIPATITLNGDVAGIEVYADSMLGKVFFNLLDNSIRHGERVSQIRVSSSQSDNGMTIAWEDNGIGIPADEKEKIFERGFGKNTGLGLYLSREILLITGITIREIGVPNKGAHFEINVPKGAYRFLDV